ncbi:MAG TPA: PQQ-binding-like beta-propeller repeat protein [Gaiellales bacterium]|nr:PQQ-binding-like beta-propeller repeat protein [Gaiellales bacterium]
MSRRRTLIIVAAGLLALLCAGAAVAYVLVTRPAGDIHNGASSPFTSTPEPPASSQPASTAQQGPDYGPPWPMYGLNPSHNRDASAQTGVHPPYVTLWRRSAHGILEYPPSYRDGVLYAASDGGIVWAQSVKGDVLWLRDFHKVLNQPAIYKGLVYIGAYDRKVYALDAKNGHTVWKTGIGSVMESPPTVAFGKVFMGALDGTVRALDAETGRVLWTFHASGAVKSSISLQHGRLYFGDYSGAMYCIGINGHLRWKTGTNGLSSGFRSGTFYSTPNVRYGRVYIGNTDGKLYSFVASTGRIAWSHSMDGWVYGSPAVWNGLVFESSYNGLFQALDARTGNVKWTAHLPYKTTSSPTVIGDYVYVSSHGRGKYTGNTWAFDPRTGRRVWHFPDGWYSTVVTAGPNRLVIAAPRYLYLLRTKG